MAVYSSQSGIASQLGAHGGGPFEGPPQSIAHSLSHPDFGFEMPIAFSAYGTDQVWRGVYL
jgi:hypothetical protein